MATGDAGRQINENKGVIELLATCELKAVGADVKSIPGATRVTAAGCEIFIESRAAVRDIVLAIAAYYWGSSAGSRIKEMKLASTKGT